MRVVIAGGGTGGHLFPGLAVARALKARVPDAAISFAGTAAGIEARVIPSTEFPLDVIRSGGLKGKSPAALLRGVVLLPLSALDAWSVISRRRPEVVIGVGGYSSGPVVGMAAVRGIPTLLLEQNAVPGITNRLLSPLVKAAAVTYDSSTAFFGSKAFVSGNPVRQEFLHVDDAAVHADSLRVLIFGGSQGAHAINVAVAEAAERLARSGDAPAVTVVCQTGARDFDMVREAFQRAGLQGRVERFIDAMDREVNDAGLIVSRAGATTLAEIMAAGRPSILIPLPTATDDHQRKNAEALQAAGAAEVIEQKSLSGELLVNRIWALAADKPRRLAMSRAARSLARPDAADRIVDVALQFSRAPCIVTGAGVLARARRFHFVGVGGIGMSGIAELLVNLGYEVSGSDMHRSDITTRLESMGVRFAEGHDARNVGDAEVLIYSSAVKASNPEMAAALSRGLTIVPRAELLGELMGARESIAVAGAHGKTTTTSMIAVMLETAGLDPTAVIGGRVAAFGSNARLGRGKYFIAEADESDGSFLRLKPGLAVITNIDQEHLDAYRDFEDLQRAFVTFANSVPESGTVVLCADDPYLRALRPAIVRRVITYGLAPDADVSAGAVRLDGFGSVCTVRGLGRLELSVPGQHNVLNALAAVAVGRELGLDWDAMSGGLKSFQGAERRFQRHGDANGVSLVEDYGHHPTEIAAVIAAARPIASAGRLIVAFQPHRYSRTQSLMPEFGRAFAGADAVFLTDIYAAGEDPISGVDVDALAGAVRGSFGGPVQVVKALQDVPAALAQFAGPGDLIVLLGAGSIGSIAPRVLNELSRARRH